MGILKLLLLFLYFESLKKIFEAKKKNSFWTIIWTKEVKVVIEAFGLNLEKSFY